MEAAMILFIKQIWIFVVFTKCYTLVLETIMRGDKKVDKMLSSLDKRKFLSLAQLRRNCCFIVASRFNNLTLKMVGSSD